MEPLTADAAVKPKTLTITAKSVKHGTVTVPKGIYSKIVLAKGAAGAKVKLRNVEVAELLVKGSKTAEMTAVKLKRLTSVEKIVTKTNTNISAISNKSSVGIISVRRTSTVKVNTPVEKIKITAAAKGTTGNVNRNVGTITCIAENATLNINADVRKIVVRGKNVTINIKDGVIVKEIVNKAEGTIVNGTSLPVDSDTQINPLTDASGEPTEPDEDTSTVNPDGNTVLDTDETDTAPSDLVNMPSDPDNQGTSDSQGTSDTPKTPDTLDIPKTDTSNSNTPSTNTADSSNSGNNTPTQENKPDTDTAGGTGSYGGDEASSGSTDGNQVVVKKQKASVATFKELKDALGSEIDDSTIMEIHVTDSFHVTESFTIPERRTVVLDNGVILSLGENVVLTVGDNAILQVSSDLKQFKFADDVSDENDAEESAGECGIITSKGGKIDAGDFSLTNANVYQEDMNGNKMLHFASNDKEDENVYLCIEGESEENVLNALNNYLVQENYIEVKIGKAASRIFSLAEDGWDWENVVMVDSCDKFKETLESDESKNIVISGEFSIPDNEEITIPEGRKILFGKDITVNGTLYIPSYKEIYFIKDSGIIVSGNGAVCSDGMTFSHAKLRKIDVMDEQIHIESLKNTQEGEVTITGEKTEKETQREAEDKILDQMRGIKYFLSCNKVKVKITDNKDSSETEQEYIVNGGSLAAIDKTYSFKNISELKDYLEERNGIGLGSGSEIEVDGKVLFGQDSKAAVLYQPLNKNTNDFIAYVFMYENDSTQNDSINDNTHKGQIVINYNDNACTILSSDPSDLTNGRGSISFDNSEQILIYSEWDGTVDENETYRFPDEVDSGTDGISSLMDYLNIGGLIIGKGSKIVVDGQVLFGTDENAIIQYRLKDGTNLTEEGTSGAIVAYISFMHGHILINYNANICEITNLPDGATSGFYLFGDEIILVYSGFDSYTETDDEAYEDW
jgi:hypothetical protein